MQVHAESRSVQDFFLSCLFTIHKFAPIHKKSSRMCFSREDALYAQTSKGASWEVMTALCISRYVRRCDMMKFTGFSNDTTAVDKKLVTGMECSAGADWETVLSRRGINQWLINQCSINQCSINTSEGKKHSDSPSANSIVIMMRKAADYLVYLTWKVAIYTSIWNIMCHTIYVQSYLDCHCGFYSCKVITLHDLEIQTIDSYIADPVIVANNKSFHSKMNLIINASSWTESRFFF